MHEEPANNSENDEDVVVGVRRLLNAAVAQLNGAQARDEALGIFQPARRVMLIRRAPVMLPIGRVWRLGVLLLDSGANVYATGSTTRVLQPGRPAFQSLSAEKRRMYRAAAFRGPFARGETVNFDASPIPLAADELRAGSGPLFVRGARALVRWNPAVGDDAAVDLDSYLNDRVGLLVTPPDGA